MMFSNRDGMQSVRSSDHWANGVNECELLGVISLVKRELQSRIDKQGTIFKLELRWNGVRDERQLRFFHYANRGKVRILSRSN